jgi:hypothetical protein
MEVSMFDDRTLAAAADRVKEAYERAHELEIPTDLLVQIEHLGGTADDAKRLFRYAYDNGVPANLVAFFALQIEAGSSAPPPAALSPQP